MAGTYAPFTEEQIPELLCDRLQFGANNLFLAHTHTLLNTHGLPAVSHTDGGQ